MSAGLSGFIQGAAGQANANYAEAGKEQDVLLQRQQAMIDRVAADNDGMRKQAQNIALKQNSYKGQYNVPDDLAYSLATDDGFEKMNPSERADYIARLKPTGNYTQPSQAVPDKTIPGFQQDRGILGGGKINVPSYTVPNSGSPPIPGRQIYSPTPGLPDYQPLEKLFGHLDRTQLTPEAQDAYGRVVQAVSQRKPPDPADIAAVSTGAANKSQFDRAFNTTTEMVSKGMIDNKTNDMAEQWYQKLGGNPKGSGVDWTKVQPTGKNNPDADAKAKEIERLQEQFPQLNKADATGIAYGTLKISEGLNGQTKIVNLVDGTAKFLQDPNAIPQEVRKEAYNQFRQTPNIVRQFDGVSSLFTAMPKAAGVTGELADKWGGQVVNMLRAFNLNDQAAAFNEYTGVNKIQNARNALTAIKAEMAKPLTQDPRLPVYVRHQLDQVMADDSHHTVEQILDSMQMLKTYSLANIIDNYKTAGFELPQGLSAPPGSPELKQGVQQFQSDISRHVNMGGNNMKLLTAMAINAAHGNDPYDIQQIFGDVSKSINGPTK